jgi:chromatin-remodeling ATPase INO80
MPPPPPALPPTPPPQVYVDPHTGGGGPRSPFPEDFAMLADPFDPVDAEDAAQEFEDSILGPGLRQLMVSETLHNNSRKRAADHGASDASSDAETQSTSRKKGIEPANKKRKVADSGATDAALPIRQTNSKGKGKGKQTREQSLDSTVNSGGAKPRKRAGARKKQDALPPQTQELLGIGSSASIAGDATPSPSRPASPALTAVSDRMGAMVYELDEDIPPLRRAKKVDDITMLKRIRTLEEAQKKVWTAIAKRDVPRVSS